MELEEALKILNESGFYADLDGDSDRIFPGAVKRKMIPPPEIEMDNLLKLKDHTYKIGLTGTLLTNNPLNAYLPL